LTPATPKKYKRREVLTKRKPLKWSPESGIPNFAVLGFQPWWQNSPANPTHRTVILAYFDFPISTGPLVGTNNKIKTLQKQAYGYRDMEFFKLKIYAIHESKYAFTG